MALYENNEVSSYSEEDEEDFFTVTKFLSLQAVECIVWVDFLLLMDHSDTPRKEDI